MATQKTQKKQVLARTLAIVVAAVMTVSIVLSFVLK